ncbi:MAG: lasso peptide biosynthesis B2 protein [Acidobacteria bacterium]|nr:lasso peptide biosynthesis B2 protein [Acidobacteriota bacterium]
MSNLRKLLDLDYHDRFLLCQSLLLLPLVGLMLKLLGFRRSGNILTHLVIRKSRLWDNQVESRLMKARRAAWLISVASVWGAYRANCLERSLALWCVLGRLGIESQIFFGARKVDGKLDAHAWVELDHHDT